MFTNVLSGRKRKRGRRGSWREEKGRMTVLGKMKSEMRVKEEGKREMRKGRKETKRRWKKGKNREAEGENE